MGKRRLLKPVRGRPRGPASTATTFRLEDDLLFEVRAAAQAEGISLTAWVSRALWKCLALPE